MPEVEAQGHLSGPDYAMVVGYFILMVGIGVYFYRYMRGLKDYFTGANSIPWWLSGVSFYMTSFSALAFVMYPALCYQHGWVGITLLWVAVPATLFSVTFFAKRWRRARIDSPVQYLETRYSPALRQLFAWHGVPVKIVDDGMKLFATGTFVHVCSGLSIDASILAAGGIMLLYTFMGGVWAVSVTDFVQFVVLTAGVLVVLPLSIAKAGGLTAIIQNSPEGFFRLTAPGYGWQFVLPVVLMYCLAWSSINWSLIQRYYCVPTEKDAVKTGWLVIGLYLIGPPLMFFPAIAARQFLPAPEKMEHVYPILCANLLPAGMLGLAIAAMFSATMSTLSGDFNVCASVLTNDVYLRLIRPKASQRQLVFVGRAMTLLVGVVGLATALIIARSGKTLFDIMVTLFGLATAPVAIPMLLGLVSKRVTNRAALLGFMGGTLAGIGLFLFSLIGHEVTAPGLRWMPGTTELAIGGLILKIEAWIILITTLVTFTVILVVSAISPIQAEALQRVEAFYRRLATPIGDLEEDRATMSKASYILSPFRVVGACVFLIGLLMLAIVPWIHETLTVMMDAGLALILMLIGAISFRTARQVSRSA